MSKRPFSTDADLHGAKGLRRVEPLFDLLPDSVLFVDPENGHILGANAVALAAYGYSREELLGLRIYDLRAPQSRNATSAQMALAATNGARFETVHQRRDGTTFPVEVSSQGTSFDGMHFLVSTMRDITERKQTEEALRAKEAQFRALFEHAIDGVFQSTRDGRALAANPAFVQMLGYESEQEVLGALANLPHGLWANLEERQIVGQLIEQQGCVRGYECEFLRKDAQKVWISLNATAVRELDGQEYFHGSLEDITERRRAEQEKAALEALLQQAQKLESVGQLAGGVAHDFNNMLGVILCRTEFALNSLENPPVVRASLVAIKHAAERSADLTRQLLAFARKQTITPTVLDLNENIARMLKLLRRLIGEHIQLVWVPAEAPWPVAMDPCQVDQILANLCVNSRDAIRGAGQIVIETTNATFRSTDGEAPSNVGVREYVCISVSDNGCGMSPEILNKIFEPFFTTKEIGKGTGLGLATVYGIVQQNSGIVRVESEPERGTTFRIYLPRVAIEPAALSQTIDDLVTERGQETILIVDDEPSVLAASAMSLDQLGYRVLAADSPSAALELSAAHEGKIDLLLTDVVMPEMDGHQLADKLAEQRPGLNRIYMSGYPTGLIADHGALDKGEQFLQKPISPRSLATKLREVLRGSGSTPLRTSHL